MLTAIGSVQHLLLCAPFLVQTRSCLEKVSLDIPYTLQEDRAASRPQRGATLMAIILCCTYSAEERLISRHIAFRVDVKSLGFCFVNVSGPMKPSGILIGWYGRSEKRGMLDSVQALSA